jgi:hypothetical protein
MHNHLWNQVQETIKEKEAFDTATFLIEGHIDDPKWRMAMRDLLSDNCSPGPYTASTGDPKFDNEEMAVVTNAELTVIAKCGPVRDATTCFDTIAIAACVNAIQKLVIDNNQETSRYKP